MLRLNKSRIGLIKSRRHYSNTTNVKVKRLAASFVSACIHIQIQPMLRLNKATARACNFWKIQIQPMLRLNNISYFLRCTTVNIQIQPMLRLNFMHRSNKKAANRIQIQPMLRLNNTGMSCRADLMPIQIQPMLRLNPSTLNDYTARIDNSNTTNVKVKLSCPSSKVINSAIQIQPMLRLNKPDGDPLEPFNPKFKYNQC